MKNMTGLFGAVLLVLSCADSHKNADAFGQFEADEVMISAETAGRLVSSDIREGELLHSGQQVATVDTTMIALQKAELLAHIQSAESKISQAEAQTAVIDQQIANMEVDLRRVRNMVQENAATQQQLDDLTGGIRVLKKQRLAAVAQRKAASSEAAALDTRLNLLNEQIARSRIINPLKGVVLETYTEQFEMTAPGKPLYKIANLDSMELTVYVSGGQLSGIRPGQECLVRLDDGKGYRTYSGVVGWISSEAEFTPKFIQTKEERINLVYAVKVGVRNDGAIKIGMPGEVIFE